MPKKVSVVVDTNIFVSALLGSRSCRKIINMIREGRLKLLFSEPLIKEIRTILTEEDVGAITGNDVEELFKTILPHSSVLDPSLDISICRDPTDNKILAIATEGKAEFIVTGDKDLLVLKKFGTAIIITPREFTKLLKA